jgi:hypothetical protein
MSPRLPRPRGGLVGEQVEDADLHRLVWTDEVAGAGRLRRVGL